MWQYRYTLKNTGNTALGPNVDPATDNHADFYVNEHRTHAGIHDETFDGPDNGVATGFGFDSAAHTPTIGAQEPLPRGIRAHHYYWEGLGDGAAWAPGQVITLGFSDEHSPGLVSWSGRTKGSGETVPEEPFDEEDQLLPIPALSIVAEALERSAENPQALRRMQSTMLRALLIAIDRESASGRA